MVASTKKELTPENRLHVRRFSDVLWAHVFEEATSLSFLIPKGAEDVATAAERAVTKTLTALLATNGQKGGAIASK
jgi:hypothetical protein